MFSCCKCVKSFEKSGDLWNHLKIHNINTKTRTKLVCHVQECFKTFYHGYSYKRHLQYHDSIAQNVSDEDSHGNAVSDDESVSDQSEVLPNEKPNEEISSSEDLASPQMNYGMHLQMLPIISKAYNSLMQPVEFLLVQFNWNSIILFQFPELPVEFLLV